MYQRFVIQVTTFDDDPRYDPGTDPQRATILAESMEAALEAAAARFDVPIDRVEAALV